MTNTELKNLRKSLGISPARFANAVDLPELLISRWESGEWKIPDNAADVLSLLSSLLREFYEETKADTLQ